MHYKLVKHTIYGNTQFTQLLKNKLIKFDKVDRNLLFTKLQNYGLSGHFVRVLYNIYAQNFIRVCSEGYLSDLIRQTVGVPQGDKLSPILFSIFIADLAVILENTGCFIVFYADDLAIGSHNLESLQAAMCKLEEYCENNFMTVNIGKTKLMKFRRGGSIASHDRIIYKNQEIEMVKSFEYLGIILTAKLSPTAHLEHLKKKAKMASCALQCKTPLNKVSFYAANRLFEAIVLSAGSYGIQVYADVLSNLSLQDFHTKIAGIFYKQWLGISPYSSSSKILSHI